MANQLVWWCNWSRNRCHILPELSQLLWWNAMVMLSWRESWCSKCCSQIPSKGRKILGNRFTGCGWISVCSPLRQLSLYRLSWRRMVLDSWMQYWQQVILSNLEDLGLSRFDDQNQLPLKVDAILYMKNRLFLSNQLKRFTKLSMSISARLQSKHLRQCSLTRILMFWERKLTQSMPPVMCG